MKFSEMKYERPDWEACRSAFSALLDQLEKAGNGEEFLKIFKEIENIKVAAHSMYNICFIRHSVNTEDPFYEAENDWWDENLPKFEALTNRMARIAVECPFREELYAVIPPTYFRIAECEMKCFSEEIIPLLQKENKLASEYGRLTGGAKIEVDGETYNLSSLSVKLTDPDRDVRRRAFDAKWNFYRDNEAEFDRIYDGLVHVRTDIAKALGYESFTELSYLRMTRLDYDRDMVANYRRQILEDVVPAAVSLSKRQAKRLGTPTVAAYDEGIKFLSGNPKPKGTKDDLVEDARIMYHEMSPETGEFIDRMIEDELWDLEAKHGKQPGGYCTSIGSYKVPFIFANFNGTSGDVDVLTHEAGHAFQYYMSRDIPVSDCQWPTMEAAEIASMSMEFNAWPWIRLFFREDTDKYKFLHLAGAVSFLPYGVLVDHFQHEIYDHPDWTPDERKACWRCLEKMYVPQKDYSCCDLLEKGCYWYQQIHLFEVPFYYIDYTLAQVCALQFWARNRKKDPQAWADYVNLCRTGGTRSFTALVRNANLKVPFEDGCLKETMQEVSSWLESIDDLSL